MPAQNSISITTETKRVHSANVLLPTLHVICIYRFIQSEQLKKKHKYVRTVGCKN